MYINAITNINKSVETEVYNSNILNIINIGNKVLNNTNYILDKKIDRYNFIKSKVLLRFF